MPELQPVLITACLVEAIAVFGLIWLNAKLHAELSALEEILDSFAPTRQLQERTSNDHRP
jgi:hypothetical protein